ncbi:hypothetical protein [Flavobacterium columnare]|uniref:YhhN-like protein n=1 Tax=Flavobacterium columnare TaxID=996 RepID=A0AA94F2U2_9FLAO|nr:hypothetical protein [Flavobacterium columnare]MCH4830845.1 hypothetical protein [Flavobacterium columnare]MCH4833215.1 hypothetical protein [Flavobacterium columnare]
MEDLTQKKTIRLISITYFATALLFLINEIFNINPSLSYLGLLRLILLQILYIYSSSKRNYLFIGVLVFVIISNFFFQYKTKSFLFYGMIAYLINRLLSLILVYQNITPKKIIPILICTIPFLFFYLYVIFLICYFYSSNFLILLFNGILMSLLGGISLSNYYLEKNEINNKNSFLLISIILFVMQNFIFILQKYFTLEKIFEPINIILNTSSLYIFYRFIILSEKYQNNK